MDVDEEDEGPPRAPTMPPTDELLPAFGDSAVGRLFAAKRAFAKTKLADFRQHLEKSNNPGQHCTDEECCRFIEAGITVKSMEVRDANLKTSAEAIAATVRWRADFGVANLSTCECCDVDPFGHCLFSIGRDRRGWELAYSCAGRTTRKDPTTICKHLVAWLEQVFRPCDDAPTHFCLLLDLHGLGVGDLDPRVAVRCIGIILNHYPDRSGQVVMLDAPWIFAAMWSFISKAIDPLSQQKVLMLPKGAPTDEFLSEYVHPPQAQFMRDMLRTKARPDFDSFSEVAASVRRSLGPCDAFTKEMRRRQGVNQDGSAPQVVAEATGGFAELEA